MPHDPVLLFPSHLAGPDNRREPRALPHQRPRNELDQQLRGLNAQIESEQESTHVLKAEWVYLANPARVEAEVKDHLDLQPTAPRRVAALRDIGDLLPLHDGVEPVQPIQTAAAVPVRVHRPPSLSLRPMCRTPNMIASSLR